MIKLVFKDLSFINNSEIKLDLLGNLCILFWKENVELGLADIA